MSNSEASETTKYVDDKTISDDTLLYRRVMNQPDPPASQIVWDENKNKWRPSSVAFCDHKDGSAMSIAIDDTLRKENLTPDSLLIGHENFSLAMFPARIARENAQGIIRNPLEGDPAHGEVFGKKTKAVKRALANGSEWYIEPNIPSSNN